MSLHLTFVYICVILWFRFLCNFAADGFCCVLDGSASWYYSGGLSFLDGQRGLKLAGLLHLYGICFHQIGMIAFRKKRHPLSFCRANCAKTVVLVCVCFVL